VTKLQFRHALSGETLFRAVGDRLEGHELAAGASGARRERSAFCCRSTRCPPADTLSMRNGVSLHRAFPNWSLGTRGSRGFKGRLTFLLQTAKRALTRRGFGAGSVRDMKKPPSPLTTPRFFTGALCALAMLLGTPPADAAVKGSADETITLHVVPERSA